MVVIANYTPYAIIINIVNRKVIDHSDISNYKLQDNSIVLQPDQKIFTRDVNNNTNIYICSDNCKYIGHFGLTFYKLMDTFLIHVGLVMNGKTILSNPDVVPSDTDFGLAHTINQSDPRLMLLNPYFYLLVVIILLVLVLAICKYVYSSWVSVPVNLQKHQLV